MKIILRKYTRYHASREWVAEPQHDQEFPSRGEAEAAWLPKQKEALRNAGASDTDEAYRVEFI